MLFRSSIVSIRHATSLESSLPHVAPKKDVVYEREVIKTQRFPREVAAQQGEDMPVILGTVQKCCAAQINKAWRNAGNPGRFPQAPLFVNYCILLSRPPPTWQRRRRTGSQTPKTKQDGGVRPQPRGRLTWLSTHHLVLLSSALLLQSRLDDET